MLHILDNSSVPMLYLANLVTTLRVFKRKCLFFFGDTYRNSVTQFITYIKMVQYYDYF